MPTIHTRRYRGIIEGLKCKTWGSVLLGYDEVGIFRQIYYTFALKKNACITHNTGLTYTHYVRDKGGHVFKRENFQQILDHDWLFHRLETFMIIYKYVWFLLLGQFLVDSRSVSMVFLKTRGRSSSLVRGNSMRGLVIFCYVLCWQKNTPTYASNC